MPKASAPASRSLKPSSDKTSASRWFRFFCYIRPGERGMKKIALAALLLTGWAGTALASSYDDLNAGIQYYNRGEWQAAVGAFDKALAANDLVPDLQFIAHFDRGQSYARLGR